VGANVAPNNKVAAAYSLVILVLMLHVALTSVFLLYCGPWAGECLMWFTSHLLGSLICGLIAVKQIARKPLQAAV